MGRPGPRLGVLVAAGILLAGCQPGAPAPTPSATSPGWRTCSFGECTEVAVPVDHADPDGPTLQLAVARAPATRPRVGTIFVNPGGPGASGRELVAGLPRTGLEAYDLVGWDPRGVGASAGLDCVGATDADAMLELDASPDDAAERRALLDASARFAAGCAADAGALLAHLSADDNARDLEALRRALDDRPLTYLGFSYGTVLGAAYADLFGEKVGRMVLDGGVDVNAPSVPQAVGLDRALAAAGPDATASVERLLAGLEENPLPVGERTLTQSRAALGVASFLYAGEAGWPPLRQAVDQASAGDGRTLLAAADRLSGRNPDGTFGGLFAAFRAIRCADDPHPTQQEADAEWVEVSRQAPVFGAALGPAYDCVGWPAPASEPREITAPDVAPPILVVGTTGDPATPFEWSEALADDLATGVLLTVEGHGHTAFRRGNACVDAAVVGHLTGEGAGFTTEPKHC